MNNDNIKRSKDKPKEKLIKIRSLEWIVDALELCWIVLSFPVRALWIGMMALLEVISS